MSSVSSKGLMQSLAEHEIGHVLGIGTLWPMFGLLATPPPAAEGELPDAHYTGAHGIAGFDAIGGSTYTGKKVPVENSGGSGTEGAHWRESPLGVELMTGYLDRWTNPLSQLTVRSLADLGYAIDASQADPYFRGMGVRAEEGVARLPLLDDVYDGPVRTLDSRGRVIRTR